MLGNGHEKHFEDGISDWNRCVLIRKVMECPIGIDVIQIDKPWHRLNDEQVA